MKGECHLTSQPKEYRSLVLTFSLLATLMLLLPLVIWVYLLLLANGISES